MNPCKCGYYPDMNKCTCTEQEVKKYMEKISGPLIDRIDLCVHMNQVTYFQLEKEEQPEDSLTIKEKSKIGLFRFSVKGMPMRSLSLIVSFQAKT